MKPRSERFSRSAAITVFFVLLSASSVVKADGPADNLADQVRPIPPPGIAVPPEKEEELRSKVKALGSAISNLRKREKNREFTAHYLPDVEICFRGPDFALSYGEFYKPAEFEFAIELLNIGLSRAASLWEGEAPWTRMTGPVIRGYRSKIDDSAQPYGLEIPANYDFRATDSRRLDVWFHGRGETLSEVAFLQQRIKGQGGKIAPADTIILHPYGRYSNANKFAGEVDLLEALDHLNRDYRIDENRTLVRGFSMGGAACWQFAVHFPGLWTAAQPGAGFSETPDFLRTFQGETFNAPWWEEKLWRWYNATDWAVNLTNLPTIAYSGEIDRQKQAADSMVAAAEKEGLRLLHLIGPQTAHAFHPETLTEIEKRLASIAKNGRNRVPRTVRFVTHTLRYDTAHWVRMDRLSEHWEPGRIEATMSEPNRILLKTSGTDAFSLHFAPGDCPLDLLSSPVAELDGVELPLPKVWSDRSWQVYFDRESSGRWKVGETAEVEDKLRKRHGLQGPIDDAFMDSFVIVTPSGKPQHDLHGEWVHSERNRAVNEWRRHFRGEARVKSETDLSEEDHKNHHIILWGDPAANATLSRLLPKLPVTWTKDELTVAGQTYDASHHTLALIYPNPENPDRYLVLNSSFTFREYDYLNNARQTPKLPDWAVIDMRTPPSSRYPGKIVAAGFFDEQWRFKSQPED